jgi:SAM-dependent methyltransferase
LKAGNVWATNMPADNVNAESSDFYRAFQERFRGAREMTKERLRVYAPFLDVVNSVCDRLEAIDLGCGRGEFLELLVECGFRAQGVDRDEKTVAATRDSGLDASVDDAVNALARRPNASQAIVSAIQIAEHLTFIDLQNLVREAHRVLVPGGLLVVETPNPENLVVATANFYLDPTHLHPIPPPLLVFLAEFFGFARIKLLRLQEWEDAANADYPTLAQVVGGASADYAIIAQTPGDATVMAATAAPFEAETGISRDALIARFDEKMALHLRALDLYAQTLANEIALKNENLIAKENEIVRLSRTLIDMQHAFADACARAAAADARVASLEAELVVWRRGKTAK